MPDPDVSDRERLLRLIDGGPEVVRELQAQRPVEAPKPPVVEAAPVTPPPVPVAPAAARPKISFTEAQKVRLAQAALAAVVAVFAIWGVMGVLKSQPKAVPAGQEQAAASGVDSLRLVGVDWGDRPVALLEDKVSGKTYFVKKNDSALGARVKDIQKDRVTVSYRGRMVELR